MIHPIKHPDPMVYQVIPKFDFANPSVDPIQHADDLAQTMLAENGLGLASNQAGIPVRAFAIKAEHIIVAFNPIIVDSSDEMVYLEEGCLSFPNLIFKIKRPQSVKVRYTEPNGNTLTTTFGGMTARVFQHELDHLDGIIFHTRVIASLERQRGMNQKKKLDRMAKKSKTPEY